MDKTIKPTFYSYFVFSLALLFYVYDYFIQVSPSVMTNQLMESFSIGAAKLGLLSAIFYYSYTVMQIPSGILLDRFGPKKIITVSAAISGLGVLLFCSTSIFIVASIGRLFIGLGAASAFLAALLLCRGWFPPSAFPVLAGFIQFGSCVGSIFAAAPLAVAVDHYGWRQTLYAIAVLAFVLAIIFAIFVREKKQHAEHTLTEMPLRLRLKKVVTNKQVLIIAALGLLCWAPVGAVGALWGIPYLMEVFHWSNVTAGEYTSLFWLGVGLGSPIIGWLSIRTKNSRTPILICFSVGLASSLIFIQAPHFSSWFVGISLAGLGFMASIQALSFSVLRDRVHADLFGTASGIINMSAIIGSGTAQFLIGLLIHWQSHLQNQVHTYSVESYQNAFIIVTISMVVGLFLTIFFLKEKSPDADKKIIYE